MPTLTVQQLDQLLQRERPSLFDANPRRSWLKHRIPGAIHIDPAGYKEDILPRDKSATLIVYCSDRSCGAAPYAARRAMKMDYRNVCVLDEGIKGWLDAGLPFESGQSDASTD